MGLLMIQKRGISDIIVTVLILLIVVVAISIVGVIVLGLVNRGSSELKSSTACRDVIINPSRCSYAGGSAYLVTSLYERKDGSALNITKLDVIFDLANGTSVKLQADSNNIPKTLETKSSSFTLSLGSAPQKMSLAATIKNSDGKESLCPATQKISCIKTPVDGVCGLAARTYSSSEAFPSGELCSSGTNSTNPRQSRTWRNVIVDMPWY